MEKQNFYVAVSYQLYADENGEQTLIEEAPKAEPFQWISGFGMTIDAFENKILPLQTGEKFDFTLTKEEAYGNYEDFRVIELDRETFSINGHFDHENIFVDAIVPLQNEEGNRFYGKVLAITDEKVKLDLNHPLAGKTLRFAGEVVEKREATNNEIQGMLARLSGEGCGCGCHDCGGDCNCDDHQCEGDKGDCGCGCGHHHGSC
ncbi:MAG: FKBP-type peptidyl-prolyl cis-trans isomerase [Prevotella sp.]|nr:FKBP-type peptidyl-prolyl cis-trans isomerase [Prevotella sp.]MCI5854124.1 FKBP-type peptidyl-prolyl cis-trans isomerase [Prevotella sp.]MDY6093363.1 FKBP-type peptidyl-prolyl cis-trans isomerase [Prevotella sp.]